MTEKKLLVDEDTINYSGLFDFEELLRVIYSFLEDNEYEKRELKNEEFVESTGKHAHVLLEGTTKRQEELLSQRDEYSCKMLKIDLRIDDMTEEEIDVDGLKSDVNKGKIEIRLSASKLSDYEGRFEQRPLIHLLKNIFTKMIYRHDEGKMESEVVSDLKDLKGRLTSHLNLNRFRKAQP